MKRGILFSILIFFLIFIPLQAVGEDQFFTTLEQGVYEKSLNPQEDPFANQCQQLYYNVTRCSDQPWDENEIHNISGDLCSCFQANVVVNTQGFSSPITVRGVWAFFIGGQWKMIKSDPFQLEPGYCWWLILRLYSISGSFSTEYAAGVEYMGKIYHAVPTYGLYHLTVNCY